MPSDLHDLRAAKHEKRARLFGAWVRQQVDRFDPVGDLARWIRHDVLWPAEASLDRYELLIARRGVNDSRSDKHWMRDAVRKAWAEFYRKGGARE